ncbi:MAG: hypothetical protein MI921_26165 [Cytophagales bacterium]|nr:hypothetical protein [Cytophagales bacterium]
MIRIKEKDRNRLINKIKTIKDKNVLDEIYRLLEIDFDDEVYITSQEQKEVIAQARDQIKNSQTISSEEADKDMDELLT